MTELTFVLYVNKNSEKFCVLNSYNSANLTSVITPASSNAGGRQTVLVTGQLSSLDNTGLGTLVGNKNTTFDQIYGNKTRIK